MIRGESKMLRVDNLAMAADNKRIGKAAMPAMKPTSLALSGDTADPG